MATKKDLKKIVSNYILENYKKEVDLKEEDIDGDGIEDISPEEVDDLAGVRSVQAIKNLLDKTDTRISTELRDITRASTKLSILDSVVDYILGGFNTTADLPNATLRNHFIQKFGGSSDNGTDLDEMSTTAGSPAPATKYAYKKKVDEGIVKSPKGAGNLPKYVASKVKLGHLKTNDKGLENPSQYLDIGYKKVDRKKQAKESKGVDYVDLHNSAYK